MAAEEPGGVEVLRPELRCCLQDSGKSAERAAAVSMETGPSTKRPRGSLGPVFKPYGGDDLGLVLRRLFSIRAAIFENSYTSDAVGFYTPAKVEFGSERERQHRQ
jgi:hypothetical protein